MPLCNRGGTLLSSAPCTLFPAFPAYISGNAEEEEACYITVSSPSAIFAVYSYGWLMPSCRAGVVDFYSTSVFQSFIVRACSSNELPISTIFFPSTLYCSA